jgi:hypothetical protein
VPIVATVAVVLVAISYLLVECATPICLSEARVNSRSRLALESKLSAILAQLPAESTILMQTGEYVGALQDAGVHLSRVVWEGNHPAWDNAIAAPAASADNVVAVQGNDDWYSIRLFPQKLEKIAEFDTPEKPRVTVYRTQK